MKTAIVYATKYGCTKECAQILKTYLHGEVNILSAKADKINLTLFLLAVLCIWVKSKKKLRNFVNAI